MSIRNMTHSFRVDIAEKIGLNAAVILSNLMHWVIHNKENGRHFYDGKYWTYNSVEAFGSLFPYLTKYQIEKALKDMECEEIIFTGNYNKVQFDRTKWYSVNWQHPIFENQVFDSSKNRNGFPEKPKSIAKKTEIDYQETGEPIPDINTYSKHSDSKPNQKPDNAKTPHSDTPTSDQFISPDDLDKNIPKNQEKKEKPSPAPENSELKLPYDSEKFKEAWDDWKEYKLKEFKFRYRTTRSEQAALSQLKNLARNETEAIKIIEQSMANGWKGLFDLKTQNQNQNEKRKPDPRFDDRRSKFEGASKRRGKVKFT